jgi:predicted ATPase
MIRKARIQAELHRGHRPYMTHLCHSTMSEAALSDADNALKNAREMGHPATLMVALGHAAWLLGDCGNYAAANLQADELIALADEKGAGFWRTIGTLIQGSLFAQTGKASNAVQMITSAITAYRSAGAAVLMPRYLSYLASADADLGKFDEAWLCIGEAMRTIETTKERWFDPDVIR